jgi:hypothetical protein
MNFTYGHCISCDYVKDGSLSHQTNLDIFYIGLAKMKTNVLVLNITDQ